MMKKLWSLIIALFVVVSISGCSVVEDGGLNSGEEGLFLIASIEHTRADVVYKDDAWQTVWSGDDKLYVTSDKGSFIFANTAEKPNRFEPEDESAEVLRDASNIVITTLHEAGCVVDSDAGKRGLSLRGEYDSLPECGRVTLYVDSAFFRLSCSEDVTLEADAAIFSGVGDSEVMVSSVTVAAGDDIWVAFMPCVEKVSLTVMVAGATVMSIEDIALSPCVIYGIGEVTPNQEPEPEPDPTPDPQPQETYVYLVPSEDWRDAGAWFAAYFWEGDNSTSVELVESSNNGIYRAVVPAGMTNVIFCRMNPAYTEFGWNSGAEMDRIWAQTSNLVVGLAPYNYYYITGEASGEWNLADYVPDIPVVDEDEWAVAGTFNGWGDTLMSATEDENIYVKRGLELRGGDEFKVKIEGSWSRNYGGIEDGIMLAPNLWLKGYQDGANIIVAYGGVYDIYLDCAEERVYLMAAGVDYTTAKEYGNDDNQAPSPDMWGLCGTHNNWNGPDIPLIWDSTIGLYVAYNAELTGEFKVRANNSWAKNYGYEGEITVDDNSGVTMEPSAGNCNIKSGTYDVYFCFTNLQLWVKTPGSDAPVVEL